MIVDRGNLDSVAWFVVEMVDFSYLFIKFFRRDGAHRNLHIAGALTPLIVVLHACSRHCGDERRIQHQAWR